MVRMSEPPPPDRSGPTPAELVARVVRESAWNEEWDRRRTAVTDAAEGWDEATAAGWYDIVAAARKLRTAIRALQEWRKRQ